MRTVVTQRAPVRQHQLQQCRTRTQSIRHVSRRVVRAQCAHAGSSSQGPSLPARLLSFVQDQYLPVALCTALVAGYQFPQAGLAAANLQLHNYTTLGIFVLSGLSLRRGEALAALKSVGAFAFGCASILAITPLAALLAAALPLQPAELATGLAVFCCMPTTLSSGVSMTQAVSGNTAMALLLTVATNFAAVFTMPFTITRLLGPQLDAAMSPWPLLVQLTQSILLPTVLGATARATIPGLAAAVDSRRKVVGYLSSTLLALVPWMQVSKAASQNIAIAPQQLLALTAAALALHLAFLAFNSAAVTLLQLGGRLVGAAEGSSAAASSSSSSSSGSGSSSGDDSSRRKEVVGLRRAVVLVASQKTLPVAVAVLGKVAAAGGGAGLAGVAVVSCVVAHLGQILVDSLLVSRWQRQDRGAAAVA